MYSATIGFFDGVHRGHRFLIDHLIDDAQHHGTQSMVITFDEHPRKVLGSNFQPSLLTTPEEKCHLLRQTGIDRLEVMHFDRTLSALSARQFMADVLSARLHVSRLFIGYDNRFGHNREESFPDYVAFGRELGMEVMQTPQMELSDHHVSSSSIRKFLAGGRVEDAALCLGYPYCLSGEVVSGCQEGRKIGFPTANILPDHPDKLIPRAGAYAVSVRIDDEPMERPAMMNIGQRPTFGGHTTTLEVHLIDYHADLYGHRLTVGFRHWLRPEQPFSTPEALAQQLQSDREAALRVLSLQTTII